MIVTTTQVLVNCLFASVINLEDPNLSSWSFRFLRVKIILQIYSLCITVKRFDIKSMDMTKDQIFIYICDKFILNT